MNSIKWIVMAVVIFMKDWMEVEGGRTPIYLETNEVTPKLATKLFPFLPICVEDSICGHLQANVKGVNYQSLCTCARGHCPSVWDPYDGHSVTQGSDQYKYCGKSPKLSTCAPTTVAYTTRSIYSTTTDQKIAQIDQIHCNCPDTHNYEVIQPNRNSGDMDAMSEIINVSYICTQLPTCGTIDVCKIISETANSYLVNRKCNCPATLRCPTVNDKGISETLDYGRGFYHYVRCQG